MSQLRVLIVEDSRDDAELILAELKLRGYQTTYKIVETKDAFLEALQELWDVILSDYVLPRFSGIEVIECVRKRDQTIPLILLSGKMGEDIAVSAIKAGASDYLLKDNLTRLATTIDRELREAENRRQRKRAEEELAEMNKTLEKRVLQRTEELQKAKTQLEVSLHEKEVLLKEVHHRVKNNLQVISSFLRMRNGKITDPYAAHLIQSSQMRIRSMSMVHDLIYHSPNLSHVPFHQYVNKLMAYLITAFTIPEDRLQLKIDIIDVWMDIEHAIPCGLILTELSTNALKYAFQDGRKGILEISLKPLTNEKLAFIVKDNGIGFPSSMNWKENDSMGLRIVQLLCNQLDGDVQCQSSSQGTTFSMTIPSRYIRLSEEKNHKAATSIS